MGRYKMNKLKYSLIVIFFLFSKIAFAQLDYCELSERTVNLHIFGHSLALEENQTGFKRGISKYLNSFAMGDKINLFVHDNTTNKKISVCKPGCPEEGFLTDLLDSSCSSQIAKRDLVKFNSDLTNEIRKAFANVGSKYDVMEDLNVLNEYYPTNSPQEVYIFHSLIPFEVNLNDEASFDAFFVKAVQKLNAKTMNFGDAKFVNPSRDENVIKLWNDLELNGKGLILNVNKELIN